MSMRFHPSSTGSTIDSVLLRRPPRAESKDIEPGCISSFSSENPGHSAASILHDILRAKIGGAFWLPSVVLSAERNTLLSLPADAALAWSLWKHVTAQVDARKVVVISQHLHHADAIRAAGGHVVSQVDPHSMLEQVDEVWATGRDDVALLGAVYGRLVRIWSPEGGEAVFSEIMALEWLTRAISWRSPFDGRSIDLTEAVRIVSDDRRAWERTRDVAVCVGMAWWKRERIREFFNVSRKRIFFRHSMYGALSEAQRRKGIIAAWSSRIPSGLRNKAKAQGVGICQVEDGFLRSVGLGSDLLPPCSIVLDRAGIYFDPSRPSDLEKILMGTSFDDSLRARARHLIDTLVVRNVSKYGSTADVGSLLSRPAGKTVILVPGQVSNDLSIRLGCGDVSDNLSLLRNVRDRMPDAHIVFRPHPDVDAGHRPGAVRDDIALQYADEIARGGPMVSLIAQVDEVHTMTSLAGFEALLRGRAVTTYGNPFYAGWGLTCDLAPSTGRRGRNLQLEELVAGALILYPLYLDPVTRTPCGPEVLVERLSDPTIWTTSFTVRLRRLQGRLRRKMQYTRMRIWPK
ncbi:capsular polysaccharide export protein, LipB/KpsS family [Gluconobacter cerinus]|uniref:capsular polysaccharide export protein, LipB/KpsS family n=1 Tax=Gluconobacter cerinus TaxID=38307 RepID=UPI001B8C1F1A|nr:hypothetical protein [Gluconobacter cerinus]MBS1068925.1 hypothetical protein [Gluconobacter cerinus]